MDPVKLKAIEVVLGDGQKVIVHEPTMKEMGAFLRALPSIVAIQKAFEAAQTAEEGIAGMAVDIPDSAYEGVFPLIAAMTDITSEQFTALPLFDGLALMRGLTVFAPNTPAAASEPVPTN